MGYVASVQLAPQASLAGVPIEPDVPTLTAAVGDDDPSGAPTLAAPLRRAHSASIRDRIRQRRAATIARPTRHLLSPDHRLGDHLVGELRCHRMFPRCRPGSRPNAGGYPCCRCPPSPVAPWSLPPRRW